MKVFRQILLGVFISWPLFVLADSSPCDIALSRERVYAGDPILVSVKSNTVSTSKAQLWIHNKPIQSIDLRAQTPILFQLPTPIKLKDINLASVVFNIESSSSTTEMGCQYSPLSPIYIFPSRPRYFIRPSWFKRTPISVFDPSGRISKELTFLKMKFHLLNDLFEIPSGPSEILILGPHALDMVSNESCPELLKKVEAGLILIVMEQEKDCSIYSSQGVRLVRSKQSVSSLQFSEKLLPSQIPPPHNWGFDSTVSQMMLPLDGSTWTPIVHVFPRNAPELMLTMKKQLGKGLIILNQFDLSNQFEIEPLARKIFCELLIASKNQYK